MSDNTPAIPVGVSCQELAILHHSRPVQARFASLPPVRIFRPMLPDSATTQERHQQFIHEVLASNTVWGLSGEEGWAVSSSHHDENIDIILFWSGKDDAKALAKEDWSNYEPVPIPLAGFLENWLVGMHQNQVMAGTNWDGYLFGEEIAALKLIMEIVEAAKTAGTQPAFAKYTDLADFETEVRQALENA